LIGGEKIGVGLGGLKKHARGGGNMCSSTTKGITNMVTPKQKEKERG